MQASPGLCLSLTLVVTSRITWPAQRPDLLLNPNLESGKTPERWFDTGAFVMPGPFAFGNAGRNILDGPGYQNINLAGVQVGV